MADKTATVTIEKVVQGGKGLARFEGRVVLVDRVLPGEDVRVSLRPRKGVTAGEFPEVLASSPLRVVSDCPFYSRCGGCDFRHTGYETELELKQSILLETLRRIGKVLLSPAELAVIASPRRNRYRIRTRFQCDGGRKGFFAKASHDIVPVDDCLLMPEHLAPVLRKTRCRNAFYLETHPVLDTVYRYRKPGEFDTVELDFPGYTLMHCPGNFIQANRFLLNQFVETVREFAGKGERLCELFAGSGFLTLPLSRQFSKLSAVEWSHSAVEMMRKSLEINGISNVSISERDCARWNPEPCDVLVLDPPREGMTGELARKINQSGIPRIVYVSCDAATLGRDIRRLDQYRVEKAVLIDMFPGTAHFETMIRLSKK
ncbi:MAG: class I SAM-dependent RNA methyltransferase [Acidobacteria bacterium]|nr:class I SAM-dependent RNA methyltransferase [Acidobacteriota bacterium]